MNRMKTINIHGGLILAALAIVALPGPGRAQPATAATTSPAGPGAVSGAAAAVSALYAKLTQIEHAPGPFAQRAQALTPIVDRVFNLPVVLQNSLGLRYRTLPEGQKQQLLDQFRQFTVARYVSNFAGGGDSFTVDPATTASPVPGDQIVHTQIIAGGSPTQVNYVMRQQGSADWQVVDVLLNGNISQVAVQRADFGSSLTSGDATPLIDSLRKKTQAFSES